MRIAGPHRICFQRLQEFEVFEQVQIPSIYEPSANEIDELVARYPLGLVVSSHDGEMLSTPLPIILERSSEDEVTLLGHFGASNPHYPLLQESARALIIFQGAHGYVSPSWLSDRTQAPTWHYTAIEFLVNIAFETGEPERESIVERLVTHMETDRPNKWSSDEMGERYDRLMRGVRPFRANVLRTRAKFKLGQIERDDVQADSIAGVTKVGNKELARQMADAAMPLRRRRKG